MASYTALLVPRTRSFQTLKTELTHTGCVESTSIYLSNGTGVLLLRRTLHISTCRPPGYAHLLYSQTIRLRFHSPEHNSERTDDRWLACGRARLNASMRPLYACSPISRCISLSFRGVHGCCCCCKQGRISVLKTRDATAEADVSVADGQLPEAAAAAACVGGDGVDRLTVWSSQIASVYWRTRQEVGLVDDCYIQLRVRLAAAGCR